MEVRHLLIRPPTDSPYSTLKTELIKRTAASEQRNLQQLISGEELGDRKATQLLRRMQQLLGDHMDTSSQSKAFLCELFLQRLPANVRMVLASTDTTTELQKLADMVDKIMDVATPTVSSIDSGDSSEVSELSQEVGRLAELVASLTTCYSRPHNRNISKSRPNRLQVLPHLNLRLLMTHSVGIIVNLEKKLRNARALATGKTLWPGTSGDK